MKTSRRILTRTAIAVVALLFASAGFVSLWRLMEERDHSLELFRTGSWTAVQAEIEALRLIEAVTAFHYGETGSREEVSRRFEIFWSRIPLLIEGKEGKFVRRLMPVEEIRRIFAQLPQIEQSIQSLTPGDNRRYRAVRAELERMRSALHDIVLRVMAHETAVENRQRIDQSYAQIFAAFTLVIICGSVLLMMLLRELRESSRLVRQSQKAAAEAAEANESKSRFLAAASHDLRQPLNALSLLLGLLQSRVTHPTSIELVEKSQESLIRITEQLNSYLDITKLDTGRIPVDWTALPVHTLLHRIANMFKETAERKGLRLRVVDCHLRVNSDIVLLERVIANLVSNALRYTETGSVLIGCRRRGDEVRIDIIDTGPGIAPEHRSAIFDEFFQIANQERAHAEGHGLGLSIVRRLVSLLGHRLELQSVVGHGSRFSVVVPLADDPPAPSSATGGPSAASTAPVPSRHSKSRRPVRRVLIIEDDALIAMSMALMIEEFDAEPITVASADEALSLVADGLRPDLIIADYRLSGQNGISAIEELRERLGTVIPACIITGDVDPSVKSDALDRNIGYLAKPITTGDLRSVMATMHAAEPVA